MILLWMALCISAVTTSCSPKKGSGQALESLDQANQDLQLKAELILNPKNIIPSRFDCEQSIKAARAATEVYQVHPSVAPNGDVDAIRANRRADRFDIIQVQTGRREKREFSNFGYVEYIPSELENALDSIPDHQPIDFANLNTHREARLIFRGTLGGFSESDWLTNRDTRREGLEVIDGVGQAHLGFYHAYLSARDHLHSYFNQTFVTRNSELENKLRTRLELDGRYTEESVDRYIQAVLEDYQILISGHSLGGALSTLAAYDFAIRYPLFSSKLTLITFAAPGVFVHEENLDHSALHDFAKHMARGTEYGHKYSAIFFERKGDPVPESTQRGNYNSYNFLKSFFSFDGGGMAYPNRPENSGVRVSLAPLVGSSVLDSLVSVLTTKLLNTADPLTAHSMEEYQNDVVSYCEDMEARQNCLQFESLDLTAQEACVNRLGMNEVVRDRYRSELNSAGHFHIMDHPDFIEIPRAPRPAP